MKPLETLDSVRTRDGRELVLYRRDQDYQIRLTRVETVGQRYELIAAAKKTQQMTLSVEGAVLQTDKSSVSAKLRGIVTVREVDERQRASELGVLVKYCRRKAPDGDSFEDICFARRELLRRLWWEAAGVGQPQGQP